MKTKILCVVVAVLLSSRMSFAQDTPKAEVSAGYSFFYVIKGFTIVNNGGSGSLAVNLNDWLGLVGDFGVYRASSNGPDLTSETFTFGPRFSYRKLPRLIPFAQALFGGYHASVNTGGIEQGNEFTSALAEALTFPSAAATSGRCVDRPSTSASALSVRRPTSPVFRPVSSTASTGGIECAPWS